MGLLSQDLLLFMRLRPDEVEAFHAVLQLGRRHESSAGRTSAISPSLGKSRGKPRSSPRELVEV